MALSDLLQSCYNKSDTVMIKQECYKVDDTILLCHDCFGLVGTTLQQL